MAAAAMAFALMPTASASASPALPLAPFVDCVHFNGSSYTAYFGYNNTGPIEYTFPVGDFNNLFPGSQDQGQPTGYDPGNDPRVFSATFDGAFIQTLNWELNDITVSASTSSPVCTAGVTAPASDVTGSSATLNGAVVPDGQDTTYSFDYGTSQALGSSTATTDAGAGTLPQLVQTPLTGLTPATKYYFRLVTTNTTDGTTQGPLQSFTTQTPTVTASPVTLSVPAVPRGAVGVPYTLALTAGGGTSPYSWSVTAGSLPPGLNLNAGSGAISGTPTAAGVANFTVTVSDGSSPAAQTAVQPLSITIDPAATTTRLSLSASSVGANQPVSYTAVVAPTRTGLRTPTGSVAFVDNGMPATCAGGVPTLNASGVATCTVRYAAAGAHAIVATYAGAGTFAGSGSQALAELVTRGRHVAHRTRRHRGVSW